MTHYLHMETNDNNTQMTMKIVYINHDNYASDQLDRWAILFNLNYIFINP